MRVMRPCEQAPFSLDPDTMADHQIVSTLQQDLRGRAIGRDDASRLEGRWRGARLSADAAPVALAELIGPLAELPLRRRGRARPRR
jgi:hypothetical protein